MKRKTAKAKAKPSSKQEPEEDDPNDANVDWWADGTAEEWDLQGTNSGFGSEGEGS